MNACPSFEELSALADGVGAEPAKHHAEGCPTCSETLERIGHLGAALRALPLAREPAPPGLESALRRASAPRRSRLLATVALGLGTAIVLAVLMSGPGHAIPEALAAEVVSQHLHGLAANDGCEVHSSDPAALSSWLSQAGLEADVPGAHGAELVGARRCSLFGEPAAAVLYRRGTETVTMFLPAPGSTAADFCSKVQGTCSSGPKGQTVCVVPGKDAPRILVGKLPADALCGVAGS